MSPRWPVNVAPPERVARIVIGAVAVIGGVVLLSTGPGIVVLVLEILLVLAGLDLVVTGALGHCPLYARLHHVSSSLTGSTR